MVTIRLRKIFAVTAVLTASAAPALAAGEAEAAKAAYLRYCSACHGEGGKGDGVVSHLMTPRPTDLTALAKANNGAFPTAKIMQQIDGRLSIRAHGDPDMPVWGEIFKETAASGTAPQAEVRGKVQLIAEHLAAIQQK